MTGVTLSAEQLAVARRRAEFEELDHRTNFVLQDYRQLRGTYDILSSRENPKICGIDDAEVVGDLVAVDMPSSSAPARVEKSVPHV